MKVAQYDTDVTDAQWKLLKKELPTPSKIGRPPIDRRIVVNAIFYVLKGGIQWRLLPESFPSWKTVYHIFRQWSRDYTLERLNGVLRNKVRAQGDKRRCLGLFGHDPNSASEIGLSPKDFRLFRQALNVLRVLETAYAGGREK